MSGSADVRWWDAVPHRVPDQIAFVVEDLVTAVELWTAVLGSDDWRVHTYSQHNVEDAEYRGRPAAYSMRLAMCGQRPQVELIESLHGPNVYDEHVQRAGYGLHHVGYFVDSISETRKMFLQSGFEPVFGGRGYGLDGDGGFLYYELPATANFIELIEVPRRRRDSESLS